MRKNWLVKLERQTIDQKKIIRKADITMADNKRKATKNEKMSMKENERLLIEKFKTIKPVEKSYEEQAKRRWKTVAKPLFSLGKLEDAVIRMAGIRREADFEIKKKGLLIFCADNGVVSEGVTQTGQEVTAVVAENFLEGTTTCCVMCRQCGAELFPVDVGMVTDTKVRTDLKVAYGTRNMTREPAMTRDQAIRGIEAGIAMAEELKDKGYQVLATGEMGIGNTTTSSAVAAVLLGKPVEDMTGRGAGLTSEGLVRKINAIKKAIALNNPDRSDAIDVLAKVGGLDIAGMAGVFIGGAALGMPVVMDGFISCVSALIAIKICPQVSDHIIASHVSKEPAAHLILKELGKEAIIHAGMCLGEGTGAVALFPMMDLSCAVYNSMSTFGDINVEQYEELK